MNWLVKNEKLVVEFLNANDDNCKWDIHNSHDGWTELTNHYLQRYIKDDDDYSLEHYENMHSSEQSIVHNLNRVCMELFKKEWSKYSKLQKLNYESIIHLWHNTR